jgi:hypothetical protein
MEDSPPSADCGKLEADSFLPRTAPRVHCLRRLTLFVLLATAGLAPCARADVVVISNRSAKGVKFTVSAADGKPVELTLAPQELIPIRSKTPLQLQYNKGYELLPNSAYFFGESFDQKRIELHEIGFRRPKELAPARESARPAQPVVITVKLLVDDDQPLQQKLWEKDLRERVADCSKILEQHCFARLEVVAVETWETNDAINDFDLALKEFESKVDPAPARIAIGFTSQFQPVKGRTNLGGVRGPFSRHALLREWNRRVAPAERLELLVHELGHFFGAAHSPETNSVMRPLLADKQANSVKFRIGFDPLNTLAMNLISEEMGRREIRSLRQLDLRTRQILAAVYGELDRALPKDDAARRMHAMLGPTGEEPKIKGPPYLAASKRVLEAIVAYAERNAALPENPTEGPKRLTGDELTAAYLKVAAAKASKLPPGNGVKGFLVATAVAFDRTNQLRDNPLLDVAFATIESDEARRHRLEVLGKPTAHGREDLLMHFAVSAALAATLNPQLSESAGVLKELNDSQGGSGFSFVDLSADLAGIAFAQNLLEHPELLGQIAEQCSVADYWPPIEGLVEGLDSGAFVSEFGSPSNERFLAVKTDIQNRIKSLKGFAAQEKTPEEPSGANP